MTSIPHHHIIIHIRSCDNNNQKMYVSKYIRTNDAVCRIHNAVKVWLSDKHMELLRFKTPKHNRSTDCKHRSKQTNKSHTIHNLTHCSTGSFPFDLIKLRLRHQYASSRSHVVCVFFCVVWKRNCIKMGLQDDRRSIHFFVNVKQTNS